MRDFNLLPVDGNPTTARIVFMNNNCHSLPPVGIQNQLLLPTCIGTDKAINYCNGCEHLIYVERPGQQTYNCKCKAARTINNTDRIIKLKVYTMEKVQKPFWCPVGNAAVRKELGLSPDKLALSDDQAKKWQEAKDRARRKEKWCAAPGITSWSDISVGKRYHLPPSIKHGRADIMIETKYVGSISARNIKTDKYVWLYKEDEDYKYMSEIT